MKSQIAITVSVACLIILAVACNKEPQNETLEAIDNKESTKDKREKDILLEKVKHPSKMKTSPTPASASEENETQTVQDMLSTTIERELTKREQEHSTLELTRIEKLSKNTISVRFTFLSGEDYFIGHATVEENRVTELKLGTK
ncbi:MAG: hypothetical protein GY854_25055 [Deltaproteobacteria bacterium]|nr:hypothetical protein [Deltaproteobacteria bacterium]